MPVIMTTSAFQMQTGDGATHQIKAGESEVSQEIADHFFVKAHLVSTPKGRMPVVEGADGLMIEADEAGQRVTPVPVMVDAFAPQLRQEGPIEWSLNNPRLQFEADARVEEARALKSSSDGTPIPVGARPVSNLGPNAELQAASVPNGATNGEAKAASAAAAAADRANREAETAARVASLAARQPK